MKKIERLPVIKLRALEPEDLDFLYVIENDEEIWNVGLTNVPYSRNLLLDYITNASGDIYVDKQVRLMIENDCSEIVGMVDLINFSPSHCRAELGIIIEKKYRKQGYAVSVLNKICEYAKNILHLHQIYAIVPENNVSSIKMLKRSGFQDVARLKDWLFDGSKYCTAIFFQIFF